MREGEVWLDFPSLIRTQAPPICHAVVQLGMKVRDFALCSVPELLLTSENLAEHMPVLVGGLQGTLFYQDYNFCALQPATFIFQFLKVRLKGSMRVLEKR